MARNGSLDHFHRQHPEHPDPPVIPLELAAELEAWHQNYACTAWDEGQYCDIDLLVDRAVVAAGGE